jgi:CubicO group peptidase (beta-lactamase class C family)
MTLQRIIRLSVTYSVCCAVLGAAALGWAQGLPQASPESVGMSSERLARVTETFKNEVSQGRLPGVVMMVARKGKLVYSEALGMQDKASGVPMSKDSIFRIYSMTKPLTSVAAMILVEEGRMQLTDPVSKFLPAFRNMQVSVARADAEYARLTYTSVAADREMTVQDLLRHTSGLADAEVTANAPVKEAYAKSGLFKPAGPSYESRDMTPAEHVDRLAKTPLIHQPGTYWEYSIATDVLGRVVEAVSGKTLGAFLDERVFQPLKMTDSGFWVPQSKIKRLAQAVPETPFKTLDMTQAPKNESGAAGGVSTAADYLRFTQMVVNGGRLDGARVLSRSTVALMTSDHLGTRIGAAVTPGEVLLQVPGYTFGLGFAVRQAPGVAGVAGSQGEFMWGGWAGTYFWGDPKEELAAVYLTQSPGPARPYYRRLFKNLVYQSIND